MALGMHSDPAYEALDDSIVQGPTRLEALASIAGQMKQSSH
jgi:hypothetical protein